MYSDASHAGELRFVSPPFLNRVALKCNDTTGISLCQTYCTKTCDGFGIARENLAKSFLRNTCAGEPLRCKLLRYM